MHYSQEQARCLFHNQIDSLWNRHFAGSGIRIDTALVEWFKSQGCDKMEKRIQWRFMSNLELLDQLLQLSRAEKFQMMLFLIAELAKEEEIVMGNESAEIMYSVHTSNSAAEQLMQLLETKQKQTQNV
ncbi:hypothetical protein QUB63_06825 [Microcoleus sp. ARI1-B5]|uniref:hypothetical protein n=1 Tax=unclassified Microcoleus TaxID=2642155 RepID=UPI002FD0D035